MQKLKQFSNGQGWFNCFIATMAMKPKTNHAHLVLLLSEDRAVARDVVHHQFEQLVVQLEALRDTGAAQVSKKGRWVANLPIGQVAFKSGFNFRNANPYLYLWLNGHLIYVQK
jgi:hypothetical protein